MRHFAAVLPANRICETQATRRSSSQAKTSRQVVSPPRLQTTTLSQGTPAGRSQRTSGASVLLLPCTKRTIRTTIVAAAHAGGRHPHPHPPRPSLTLTLSNAILPSTSAITAAVLAGSAGPKKQLTSKVVACYLSYRASRLTPPKYPMEVTRHCFRTLMT